MKNFLNALQQISDNHTPKKNDTLKQKYEQIVQNSAEKISEYIKRECIKSAYSGQRKASFSLVSIIKECLSSVEAHYFLLAPQGDATKRSGFDFSYSIRSGESLAQMIDDNLTECGLNDIELHFSTHPIYKLQLNESYGILNTLVSPSYKAEIVGEQISDVVFLISW